MTDRTTFPLAKMSTVIAGMTWLVLALPVLFAVIALTSPGPVAMVMGATAAGLVVLYAGVWVWYRPTHFEVTEQALSIVWPWRTRMIERQDIAAARTITTEEFRSDFGWAMRIGVGGLWGGFGWLWTRKRGTLDFYISRLDGFVLVERHTGRTLLITPERPDELVVALASH